MQRFNAYVPRIAGGLTLALLAMVFGSALYTSCTYVPVVPSSKTVRSEEEKLAPVGEEAPAEPVKRPKSDKKPPKSANKWAEEGG